MNGIFNWKVWQGLGSTKGVADIIGLKRVKVSDLVAAGIDEVGVGMAIEVKTQKGKLSEYQLKFLENWSWHGGIAIVARSVDDVEQGLK